jgi:hypothetical protein
MTESNIRSNRRKPTHDETAADAVETASALEARRGRPERFLRHVWRALKALFSR